MTDAHAKHDDSPGVAPLPPTNAGTPDAVPALELARTTLPVPTQVAAWLYVVGAASGTLSLWLQHWRAPVLQTLFDAWTAAGVALYGWLFAWGAWRTRPLPGRTHLPSWALVPLLGHAIGTAFLGAAVLALGLRQLPARSTVSELGTLAATPVLLLGCLPGLLLNRVARGAWILVVAGLLFPVLWEALLLNLTWPSWER